MKFLVNKSCLITLFVCSKMLLAFECIDIWHESNSAKITSNLIVINATMHPTLKKKNIDSLKIYIDKINSKIKIESSKQVLLFDKKKSVRLLKEEKQLYIDEPDSSIFIVLSSIFNLKNIETIKKNKFEYKLKLESNFNKTKLLFSKDCSSLESIRMIVDQANIIINNINFESYSDIDSVDIFKIGNNYSKYDLRK